ncbi:MAG: calcium-binding protein [Hyphomicrobium sp.]
MAEWFYTRVFNTDGTTMSDDPFELNTGTQPMTPGGDLVELLNGDNVYIQYGILGLANGTGADAIRSTGGSHFIRIDGGIGSLTGNVIDISGTQNENQIFITTGGGMDVFNGTGDAIRLTGATVSDTFNDITNDGYITSAGGRAIFTTVGDLSLVNSGSIIGNTDAVSMVFGSVVNRSTGLIGGGDGVGVRFASLAGQESIVVNDGVLGGGDGGIVGGAGMETVINNGQILGDILLGNGNDTYDASTGGRIVGGTIDLGAGDDVGIGSGARELFTGGTGNDIIESGAGDDTLRAGVSTGTDGDDLFDGEGGRDTYSAVSSSLGVVINLAEGNARGTRIGNDTLIDI